MVIADSYTAVSTKTTFIETAVYSLKIFSGQDSRFYNLQLYGILVFRFLELKLRTSGCQGLYLTISTRDFRHSSKGFVKLAYSLTSNFPKATRVINEADVFDREGSGWGYEEFFPLSWAEFKDQLKRTPLIITSQVSLLE